MSIMQGIKAYKDDFDRLSEAEKGGYIFILMVCTFMTVLMGLWLAVFALKIQGGISILFIGSIMGIAILVGIIVMMFAIAHLWNKWWFWASLFALGAIGTTIEQLGR